MKTIFLEARYSKEITLPKKELEKIPENIKKIALFTTVQFLDSINGIKKQLQEKNKNVFLIKARHSKHKAQILGCGVEKIKTNVDAFLYIGDGLFHPKTLLLKNRKPVFSFNPFTKKLSEVSASEVEKINRKINGLIQILLVRFLKR